MARISYPDGKFFDYLSALNGLHLADFNHWVFHPAMLFQSQWQWWGEGRPRPNPHEGLDICWYRTRSGQRRALPAATVIPAPFSGRIVQVSPDFLGQSIFLLHGGMLPDGSSLLTALGHTQPLPGIEAGLWVNEGEGIAHLAVPAGRPRKVPPHLHLTVAVLTADSRPGPFQWETLGNPGELTLLDPLVVFPVSFALTTLGRYGGRPH